MKLSLIFLLVTALLFSFTGCMRGGNADEGDDGYLDEEETHDGVISDAIDDIIPDNDDRLPDGNDDPLTDNDGSVNNDDGILEDDGINGFTPDRDNARSRMYNNRTPGKDRSGDDSALVRDSRAIF